MVACLAVLVFQQLPPTRGLYGLVYISVPTDPTFRFVSLALSAPLISNLANHLCRTLPISSRPLLLVYKLLSSTVLQPWQQCVRNRYAAANGRPGLCSKVAKQSKKPEK